MAKPGPKKRFDGKIDFPIEQEYVDLLSKIAEKKNMTRSAVMRRLVKENLDEFIKNDDEQTDLVEELRNEDI